MEEIIRACIAGIIGLTAFYIISSRPKELFKFFIFTAPFVYFSQTIGIVLTPAKLIGCLFIGYIVLSNKVFLYRSGSSVGLFFPYLIYILFLTLIMMFFWPEYHQSSGGLFYGNTGRGFVQISQQVIGLSITLLMIWCLDDWSRVEKAYQILTLTLLVTTVFGFYVFMAQLLGLPYFGIARAEGINAGHEALIASAVDGVLVPRAYSFSGEPKGLASDIVLLGTLLLYMPLSARPALAKVVGIKLWISFALVVLILTLSSSGFILFPIAMLIGVLTLALLNKVGSKLILACLWAFGAVSLILLTGLGDWLLILFEDRVINRLLESGLGTYAEDAMLKYWQLQPLSAFFGTGLGGSHFYVRLIDPHTYSGKIAAPRGIVGFIGDKGLIGFGLYIGAILACLRLIWKEAKYNSSRSELLTGVIIFIIVGWLLIMTKAGWYLEWLHLGILIAVTDLCVRDSKLRNCKNAREFPQ